jgi:asparagine synthase (glutamine-hydrolysing)
MCGIVGGIGSNSLDVIHKNLNLLNRRGPDHQAIKTFGNGLTLGSTRLAMTDPLPRSNQPMVELNTGNVILFNGEIYNYKILRKSLINQGINFDTDSDTEVLLKSMSFYGSKIIPTFEGMFSFTFYDKKRNVLTIARDYLGKKPLYYFLGRDSFFFASQIEFVNKYINDSKLNLDSIKTYLQLGYLIDPKTIFQKINSVKPGEIIRVDLNNFTILSTDSFIPNSILKSEDVEISTVVDRALLERVEGHSKFAISLSGGIDSTILALQCSKLGFNAETYSMAWSGADKTRYQSDAIAAKKIASKLGLINKTIEMPGPDKLNGLLSEYVKAMGEPNSNPTGLSMMILYSEIAKDNHRLVLTGDGADEVFGGYKRYTIPNQLKLFPKFESNILKKIIVSGDFKNKYFKNLVLALTQVDSDEYWLHWHLISQGKLLAEVIKDLPDNKPNIYGSELLSVYSNTENNASNLMFKDLKTWLPMESNRKLDRISMWYSIEARSPFQSEAVIGNGYQKMNNSNFLNIKKELLVQAFPDLKTLPVVSSKHGFISPIGFWLRNNKELITESLNSISNYLPFERNQLVRLGSAPQSGNYNDFKLLWSLIVLNRWLEINK